MNHGLMEVGEKHPLWAIKKCLCLPLSTLVLSIPKSCIWGWIDWQSSLTRHISSNIPLCWPEVGTSTVLTEARISDLDFGNTAVCHGGKGRRILDTTLRDLEQNSTKCSAHLRVGKTVLSTLCHQTCPGFLICLPCPFCLVQESILLAQKYK